MAGSGMSPARPAAAAVQLTQVVPFLVEDELQRIGGLYELERSGQSCRKTRREAFGKQMVSLEDARRVMTAAEKKAAAIGQPMNIAVTDEGGNLVAHIRMDGGRFGTIDLAINKAFTSSAVEMSTKDLAVYAQPGGPFFGIHVSNHGRIVIFAGGIPLKRDGKCVGAIGVSGGSGDQDQAVAEAGANAF